MRKHLVIVIVVLVALFAARWFFGGTALERIGHPMEGKLTKPDAEWREQLTAEQYRVRFEDARATLFREVPFLAERSRPGSKLEEEMVRARLIRQLASEGLRGTSALVDRAASVGEALTAIESGGYDLLIFDERIGVVGWRSPPLISDNEDTPSSLR